MNRIRRTSAAPTNRTLAWGGGILAAGVVLAVLWGTLGHRPDGGSILCTLLAAAVLAATLVLGALTGSRTR